MNLIVASLFIWFLPTNSYPSTLPLPRGLEADVQFWEDMFSKYQPHHCVFHDSNHLDVIYIVKELPHGTNPNRYVKKQALKIKDALRHFSKHGAPRDPLEKLIYDRIPRTKRHLGFLSGAPSRVRCQNGITSQFMRSLDRSKKYLPMIHREIKKRGLPRDLAFLPHLESGFHHRAHSKVGAKGLWQLMKSTVRGSLMVTGRRDERLDPMKSTQFALSLLESHYKTVGSWPLALTGYNYGINGVKRAVKKFNTTQYMVIRRRHRSRFFGFAAKNFYPSFLAVRNLALRLKWTAPST